MSQRADYLEQCILQYLERAHSEFHSMGHKGMAESAERAQREVRELTLLARSEQTNSAA